jgi:hypothetical protein
MPKLRVYDVFISHAWDYNDEYYRLERMLDEVPLFLWKNLSVPKHDPIRTVDELEYQLRNQMRAAAVFLILGGMYCAHRLWIDFEMTFAQRIGKPIIGIRPWGAQVMPLAVQNGAWEVVGWNSASIVGAIRRYAEPREI